MTLAEELMQKHGFIGVVGEARIEAAINEAIERCAEACEDEAVELAGPGDDAYNMAIGHAAEAIRSLKNS